MLTLMFFAFLAGLIAILAPCIWPLLPLILGVSSQKGKSRPLGIVLGIVTSFTIFTLFLTYLLAVLSLPPDIFRLIAVVIILLLGITMVVPKLTQLLEGAVSKLTSKFGGATKTKGEGFGSGYISGFFLGALWTPCAGPILAAIATLAATRSVTLEAFFVTLSFAAGVGVPLFIISKLGQKFFVQSRKLSPHTAKIQQVFGVIMIIVALAIMTGADKKFEIWILNSVPGLGGVTGLFENNSLVEDKIQKLNKNNQPKDVSTIVRGDGAGFDVAPEFTGITGWLNTYNPITLEELKGQVVLVDFWTYSCINCVRTLPYVTGWYEKYKDDGFVVIGVHTPEFAFERDVENVAKALKDYNITYPVAQDNDYKTWRAYENRYWPAHYLIDANGRVRYTHFGEGEYDKTERMIQSLLSETKKNFAAEDVLDIPEKQRHSGLTPETYLGYGRVARFFSVERELTKDERMIYTLPEALPENGFAYGGEWLSQKERSIAGEDAVLKLHYDAQNVFLVMSAPEDDLGNGEVEVLLDGEPLGERAGTSINENSSIIVDASAMYTLVNDAQKEEHELEIRFLTPGISVYAFTFG